MTVYPGKMLEPGMSGRMVLELQKAMNDEAGLLGCDKCCDENGVYDKETEKSVRSFRLFFGLPNGNTAGYFLWNRLVNKC